MTTARRVADLAEREAAALLAYFERRVEPREDAADLVGETLLVLWRRARHVPTDETQARMWLFGVARRVLSTHRRGRRRRLALADRLRAELAVADMPSDALVRDVRAAVGALPERDRELVALVHWEGFALTEAAGILGIRPGAARMRYARARERLARMLGARQSPSDRLDHVP